MYSKAIMVKTNHSIIISNYIILFAFVFTAYILPGGRINADQIIRVFLFSGSLILVPTFEVLIRKQHLKQYYMAVAWVLFSFVLLIALFIFSLRLRLLILVLVNVLGLVILLIKHTWSLRDILLLFISLLLGSWFVSSAWGTGYQNPNFLQKLFSSGVHKDTLFQLAVVRMIDTYGIPTTGIDGTPYLHYHWGSNYIALFIKRYLNISFINVYNIGIQAIFIPLFFQQLLSLIRNFVGNKVFNKHAVIIVFILSVSLIGILPYEFTRNFLVNLNSMYVSESYLTSIVIFLTVVSLIYYLYKRNYKDKYIILLLIMLILGSALIKISVSFAFFLLIFYYGYHLHLYKNTSVTVGTIIVTIGFLFLIPFINNGGSGGAISLFHIFRSIARGYELWHIVGFYFWFWIVLILVDRKVSFRKMVSNQGYSNKQEIMLNGLLFITIMLSLPGIFMSIGGASAYYFSNIHKWLCLPVAVALIVKNDYIFKYYLYIKTFMKKNSSRKIVSLLFISLLIYGVLANVGNAAIDFYNYTINGVEAVNTTNYEKSSSFKSIIREIDALNTREKKQTTIYIDKTVDAVWKSNNHEYAQPFILPALTGVCLINGYPTSFDVNKMIYYGYKEYWDKEKLDFQKIEVTPNFDELKQKAVEEGFESLIVLKRKDDKITFTNYKL